MKLLIVIPAYNEGDIIQESIETVYEYCGKHFLSYDWKIVVSDNASTDTTQEKVVSLTRTFPRFEYLYVGQKGKGIAIRTAWEKYDADVSCFMDADLSTDISALTPLVNAITHDRYDVACGSRYERGSLVIRSSKRKCVSFFYRLLLKSVFHTHIKDAPCGFKAINQEVKKRVLPLVENNEWFFDSELVIIAEKMKYKIREIPVMWHDIQDIKRVSKVKIFSLGLEYLKNVLGLRKRLLVTRKKAKK